MAREDEVIDSFTGNWRFLSNFSLDTMHVPGDTRWSGEWRTAEHLFQAMKTRDPSEIDRVRSATTPGIAKRLGRKVALRSDWDEVRIPSMQMVILCKFKYGSLLAERLLNTGEAQLVEGNTWGDTFWGVCDGVGENWLGRILMHRRELLQAAREHSHG